MRPWMLAPAFATALAATASANTYTVRNVSDSGPGSLRRAIEQANLNSGADKIVFRPGLKGRTINLASWLPPILGQTTIRGDVDADGAPDIVLNGRNLSSGNGLLVVAHKSIIAGLCIINFPDRGIDLMGVDDGKVRCCHLGVNLAGTRAKPNGLAQIRVVGGQNNRIGGPTPATRNVIAVPWPTSGPPTSEEATIGVAVWNSQYTTVANNYIGVGRDGLTKFGDHGTAIDLRFTDFSSSVLGDLFDRAAGGPPIEPCEHNTIGGTSDTDRNVIAGCETGIAIRHSDDNVVQGNYLGLGANGNRELAVSTYGVILTQGSTGNTIGGTSSAARNVFGRVLTGVAFCDAGTRGNKVQGNYFGLNAAGTRQRFMYFGIIIRDGSGAQTIGGGSERAGNCFANWGDSAGVSIGTGSGAGTLVRHNTFGMLPDGSNVTASWSGVLARSRARILDNRFANLSVAGVDLMGTPRTTRVLRNTFRNCEAGARLLSNGRAVLGNLNNPSTNDDGGNVFRRNNAWYIRNETPYLLKAEGNWFGTTSSAEINKKIYDKRDDGSLGRVDFNPLRGGIAPTGSALALTASAATPTAAGGAEIVFSLSAPAQITACVLNIAGRPVATVARERGSGAGPQRLLWSGRSDSGTCVPAGAYLVRLTARNEAGQQATALMGVRISR